MDGVLLINKPNSWTSNDVIRKIKKELGMKRVGHEGTLDPFATGLLIVFLGKATKIIPFCELNYKRYYAKMLLGTETDTADLTGKITFESEIPNLDKVEIEKVLKNFIGVTEQIPPMYSAKKNNGQRLYELAREGKEVKRDSIPIEVKELNFLSYKNNIIEFEAQVSRGTYIRTLAEDIAKQLGTVAHLVELKRLQIEKYNLNDAVDLENIKNANLIPISKFLSLPQVIVSDEQEKKILNGQKISLLIEDKKILAINEKGNPLAICLKEKKEYRVLRGLW